MNEAELERFESQAAEMVSAAKGLFGEFESQFAQAVNDQRVSNAQAREEAVRLQAVCRDVSSQLKTLTESARKEFADIRNEWKQPLQDAAKAAGAAQAQAFGEQISVGLKKNLEGVSRDARFALGRYHWTSIASWAIGAGIAIPLTVTIGVWALLPSVEGVDSLRVRVAMLKLERCEIDKTPRLCIAIDDTPKLARSASGAPLVPVRGL